MKVRITKAWLGSLPAKLAHAVDEFGGGRKGCSSIEVCYRDSVPCAEDATVLAFSPDFSRMQLETVSGEFSGLTRLSPTATIPLPARCTVLEKTWFCGKRYLRIYHNPAGGALVGGDVLALKEYDPSGACCARCATSSTAPIRYRFGLLRDEYPHHDDQS